MDKPEKISVLISKLSTFEKPLLIMGLPFPSKVYITTKQIEKQLGRVSVHSCKYSKFISQIENDTTSFIVLDEFERVWDDKEICLWASKRKNMVLIATLFDLSVYPEHLKQFFTIKEFKR